MRREGGPATAARPSRSGCGGAYQRLVVGAVAVVALALVVVAGGPAPAGAVAGACANADGVTVVVDFGDLGGGVNVACAPNPVTSGFGALTAAGVSYQTAARFPGFLCRIAGKPAEDPCVNASPATAYWSYWLAVRGGAWCASPVGAGGRTPPPGTVEGWSFARDPSGAPPHPPGVAPPAPLHGVPVAPLGQSDCTSSVAGLGSAASTTTAPAAPVAGSEATGSGGGTVALGPGTAPGPAVPTSPAPSPSTAVAQPDGADQGRGAAPSAPANEDEGTSAGGSLGPSDLGDSGQEDRGPGGVLVAALLVGAVGGAAVLQARRRTPSRGKR